ncbi:MAG: hypothetical protein H0T73_22010 [Ardenticatenales bacterium]|nr:hypothetical protein [Ardenticatenales bacterium]
MGLSSDLTGRIRETMLRCGPFRGTNDLSAIFVDSRISAWRYLVPEAGNEFGRAMALIAALYEQENTTGENALVLLLRVLSDLSGAGTGCRGKLAALADELAQEVQGSDTEITLIEKENFMPESTSWTPALRDLLADIYPDPADARRVAQDAGLNLASLDLKQTPINIWHDILNEAQKQERVEAIITVAREQYPKRFSSPGTDGGDKGGKEGVRTRRELTTKEKQELAKALLALPSMADNNHRQAVIGQLRFASQIPTSTVAKIHVLNIVTTCLGYTNGINDLVEILGYTEEDGEKMQAFEETVKRLLP